MSGEAQNAAPLSYEAGENGASPPIFNRSEGFCPVTLPASGEQALIFASRTAVITALTGRDFGVAPLEDKHAVTGAVCQRSNGMLRLDKPHITDLKRHIGPFFSEKHVEQWRPGIEQAAAIVVKSMTDGPPNPDFSTVFSDPFIAKASSLTAGIPLEDWPQLRELSDTTLALVEDAEDLQAVKEAWDGLYDYCTDFIAKEPEEIYKGSILRDVITAFKKKGMEADDLLPAFATIINGFPTPGPILDVCTLELMKRPEVVRACLDDPTLWPATIEELMRYRAHFAAVLPRIAMRDVMVEGTLIPKGQAVIPSLRAAAHDPSKVDNPDIFDIRQKASRSIVFGTGAHLCPGAALTRQWLQVALKEVFTTLPNLRLAIPEEDLRWQKGILPVPEKIPVTWG